MVRRFVAAVTALGLAAAALSGCSTGTPSEGLPPGVSIDVFQARIDVPKRVLEISVLNDSAESLTITGARFSSNQFDSDAEWTKKESTTVRAGARINLPVVLPAPTCTDHDLSHEVELDFTMATGRQGQVRVPAIDRLERLPRLNIEDCLGETLARNATITTADTVASTSIGGRAAATLVITITPTAAAGSVELHSLRGTVLLNLVDPLTGERLDTLPIDRSVDASSAPFELLVALEPQRCDPHVVAEDKRGTYLPMQVTTADGTEGTIYLPASQTLRESLYAFVATSCAFPPAA